MPSKWLDLGIDWLNPPENNTVLVSAGMIELIEAANERTLENGITVYDRSRCHDIRYSLNIFKTQIERCMGYYRDLDFNEEGLIKIGLNQSEEDKTVRVWSSDGAPTGWARLEYYTGEDLSVFYATDLIDSKTIIFSDILRLGYIIMGCFTDFNHDPNRDVLQIDSQKRKYCNGLGLDPNALTAYNQMLSSEACYELNTINGNSMWLSGRMEVRKFTPNYRYDSDKDYEQTVDFTLDPKWINKGASLSRVTYYRYTAPFGSFNAFGSGVTNGLIEKVNLINSGGGVFTYQASNNSITFDFTSATGKRGFYHGRWGERQVYFPVDSAGFLEYYTP